MTEDIRKELLMKSQINAYTADPKVNKQKGIPQHVNQYHSLVSLDTGTSSSSSIFAFPTSTFKSTSGNDGHTYILKKIEGFKLASDQQLRYFFKKIF